MQTFSTKTHKVVFIVGGPATGKTTLTRRFLRPFDTYLIQKPKWTVSGEVCAAGHYGNGTFDGSDTLPFNGAMKALEFWRDNSAFGCEYTFLDGDRMTVSKYVDFVAQFATPLCIHLHLCEEIRMERSKVRSNQNQSWAKGRVTKSRRFYENFKYEKTSIDSSQREHALFEESVCLIIDSGK